MNKPISIRVYELLMLDAVDLHALVAQVTGAHVGRSILYYCRNGAEAQAVAARAEFLPFYAPCPCGEGVLPNSPLTPEDILSRYGTVHAHDALHFVGVDWNCANDWTTQFSRAADIEFGLTVLHPQVSRAAVLGAIVVALNEQGDGWPERFAAWREAEAEKAQRFRVGGGVSVAVPTARRAPLSGAECECPCHGTMSPENWHTDACPCAREEDERREEENRR